MRAWLLLLAVLATFQANVQVASTEDNIASTFITAIAPIYQPTTTTTTSTPSPSIATITTTTIRTTQLTKSIETNALDSSAYKNSDSVSVSLNSNNINNSLNDFKTNIYNNNNNNQSKEKEEEEQKEKSTLSEIRENDNNLIEISNIEEIETNELQQETKAVKEDIVTASAKVSKSDNSAQQQQQQIMAVKDLTTTTTTTDKSLSTTTATMSTTNRPFLADDEVHTQKPKHHHTHSKHNQSHHQQQHQQQQQHHHHHHHNQEHHQEQQLHDETTTTTTTPANVVADVHVDVDADADARVGVEHMEEEKKKEEEEEDNAPAATYSNKEIINEKAKPDPSTLVQIENSLLSLFNMKRPPKIDRSKIVIPEAMKKLYAQIMGHEIDSVNIPKPGLLTKSANTVRSFTHQDSKIDDRFPHHHRFRLYFDIKSIPAEEKLKAAELQLSREAISHAALHPRLANRTRYQVLVYDITRVGVKGKREPSYLLLDNKTIRLNSTETVSLDVQPAVYRWLGAPKKNYGLLVEVRTSRALKPAPHRHVRLRRSLDEPHDDWQHKQPLLFTYTDDGRHKSRSIRDVSSRTKRAGRRPHRRKNSEEICRRHSLYVDFSDVGWNDWIVAPPGYDAFYCHGKCPFPLADHLNSTNHAVVQTLVNNINPGKVPKACCVPTQLEGISMLYLNDQSTVVLKNYQDMTVVGCGCR